MRAKRDLKKKFRSGTSSSAVNKIKERLESLKYLSWLDSYVKTRPLKSHLCDNLSGDNNLFDENDNQEDQSLSNETPEGEVSLASLETNRNKSNPKFLQNKPSQTWKKNNQWKKKETVKKSAMKKILKTKN